MESNRWISADECTGWAVMRIDDNGNVFVVQKHLSQSQANAMVLDFTARAHKQFYWVVQDSDAAGINDGLRQ